MPKYVVRYGAMRHVGVLNTRGNTQFPRGTKVVARTNRGMELGEVLCEATDEALAHLQDPARGQIIREASDDDGNEETHMRTQARSEFEICKNYVEKLNLVMQLVDVEHIFGGERIVVYYLSEARQLAR